jgi:hypothetical protein
LLKPKPEDTTPQRNDDDDVLPPNDHARLVLLPCGCGDGDGDGDGVRNEDLEADVGNCVKVTSEDAAATVEEERDRAERSESDPEWRTCWALRSLPPSPLPGPGPGTARGAILGRSCPPLLLRVIDGDDDDDDDDLNRSVFMIVSVLFTSNVCRNE